ncbi:MAG: hypothetical protein ACUVX8_18115 [Candidatus Zipacnadales bacterium]
MAAISLRRAAVTHSPDKAVLAALMAALLLTLLPACSKFDATGGRESARGSEPVVVYVAPLMSEHPLYAEVQELSEHLLLLTESPDLHAVRTFMDSPLGRTLMGPPDPAPGRSPRLIGWEEKAAESAAAQLREAEELIVLWPDPTIDKTRARLTREAEEDLRRLRSEAELMQTRVELETLYRYQGELARLRHEATSDDVVKVARALERQAQIWREVAVAAETTRREVDERLRALTEEHTRRLIATTAAIQDRAKREGEEHLRDLRASGDNLRQGQSQAVAAATKSLAIQPEALQTPEPPKLDEMSRLLEETEAAQRAVRARQLTRLNEARARLLRQIARSTRTAVQAVALANNIDVRFAPIADKKTIDATEEMRLLLREYWAARTPISTRRIPNMPYHHSSARARRF